MRDLASCASSRLALREHVLPHLGLARRARARADAAGGDVTFAIDAEAEAYLEAFLAERRAGRRVLLGGPRAGRAGRRAEHVLVVDPIDGTRPALAGLESGCVSVAAAPLGDGEPDDGRRRRRRAWWRSRRGACFLAERGAGVAERRAGRAQREHGHRPDVLDLRLPRPPGAPD